MLTMKVLAILTATVFAVALALGIPSAGSPSLSFDRGTASRGGPGINTTSRAAAAAVQTRSANAILDDLAAQYRYLDGVTVTFGPTPDAAQAVAYYSLGRIVIDPAHDATLEDILAHEIWHIIDWREDGRIDWHESLPPNSASTYRKG